MPVFVLTFCYSCKSEKAPPREEIESCDTAVITSARIYAIIQQNCTDRACHPGGSSPSYADFSTLDLLKTYIRANGTTFEARVTGAEADMPQYSGYPPLSGSVRDSIACWIKKGMP